MATVDQQVYRFGFVAMDTDIAITIITPNPEAGAETAAGRAFQWFADIEAACSRFDPQSELVRLTERIGGPVQVSPLLFELTRFALDLARSTNGAFDPTIGHVLEQAGFNRNYRTGQPIAPVSDADSRASFEDVLPDLSAQTITLRRPVRLDLGAVAKGLAIDLAVRELVQFASFAVDAGGDLFVRGHNPDGRAWRIGVQHPRLPGELALTLRSGDGAVCTSGGYERRAPQGGGHHIVDPRTGHSPDALASVTVLAPTALVADGLATAAFVLGLNEGRALLVSQGVEGVFLTGELAIETTRGFTGIVE